MMSATPTSLSGCLSGESHGESVEEELEKKKEKMADLWNLLPVFVVGKATEEAGKVKTICVRTYISAYVCS